jgi:hypothetical protein
MLPTTKTSIPGMVVLIGKTNAEATITAEPAEMVVADLGTKAKDGKSKFAAESFLRDSHTHVRICLYQLEIIIFSASKYQCCDSKISSFGTC